jgi:sugar phosphate permease
MNLAAQQDRSFRRNRVITISLAALCLSFQALSIYGVALFLPEIRKDLGISFTEGGALSAALTIVYALMQVPAGYLVDRFGSRIIFFYGSLGNVILSLAFGLISSYWQGIASQAVSGVFRGLLFVSSTTLLTSWFSPSRRATAIGLSTMGVFAGQLLVNGLGPPLADIANWRLPFIVFSSMGALVSLFYLRFVKEFPRTGSTQKISLLEMSKVLRYRSIWFCCGIQYVRHALFVGIGFWLPSLLIEEKGIALQVAGIIMAFRALVLVPSNLMGGYVSDKLRNPVLVIGISLVILLITTAVMVRVDNIALLLVIILVNAFFAQFYFGSLFVIPVEILGSRMAGTATGFTNLFANLGSFTFAYLLGVLKDASGSFESGFNTMAVMCIVGLVFTILLGRIKPKAVQTAGRVASK